VLAGPADESNYRLGLNEVVSILRRQLGYFMATVSACGVACRGASVDVDVSSLQRGLWNSSKGDAWRPF